VSVNVISALNALLIADASGANQSFRWTLGDNGTILLITAAAVGLLGHFLVFRILKEITQRTKSKIDDSLIEHCYRPSQWIIVLLVVRLGFESIYDRKEPDFIGHLAGIVLIILVSWLVVKLTSVLQDYVMTRFRMEEADNLRARKIQTQFRVLKRIVLAVVTILAMGTILITFDKVRQLGTTILASAGIIGIVVGMAAQRTIGTFIAGLQIAFTQPIRLDDVVIVENEWGRIEEITLTYVVVKIWDLRRLVVPITYFIENPFQNWTRQSSDILGTVYLYTDYTIPIDAVRAELSKIVSRTDLWDRKVCALQVTNTTEQTIELRALVSAADASKAWSLRCHTREKLIEFIRNNYPQSLPTVRAQLKPKQRGDSTIDNS